MKKLFLYGPLLWLRRIIIFLLAVLIMLGLILYFAANSPLAIKKAVDTFAKDYNITYDAISGNAISGIEIKQPRFKNETLATDIVLKWNPNTLANKVITVQKLHIKEGNVDAIKALIAYFSKGDSDDNISQEESNSSSFDFTVDAGDVNISLRPFVQSNVLVRKAVLISDNLMYKEDEFSVDDVIFELDTNVTHIFLKGNMKNQEAKLSLLDLKDVNLSAILPLFEEDDNSSAIKETADTSTKESSNIFIPQRIQVEKLHANIVPFTYEPIKVKHITLDAQNIIFDKEKLVLKDADIDLNATTNLSNLYYKGKAHNNHLLGKMYLTPKNRLYELYDIPLRKEAIAKVTVDLNASAEHIIADVYTKGKQILKVKKGSFNIDVDRFVSHIQYDMNASHLKVETEALVNTPYAKNIKLKNTFMMDETIHYEGEAKVKTLIGMDAKLAKSLKNVNIIYKGTEKYLDAKLNTEVFYGTFKTDNFKSGDIHLESRKPLVLREFLTLPEKLKEAKATLIADAPLDFKNLSNISSKVKLLSNVVNVNADVAYGKAISIKGKVDIPKNSLLKAYSSDVQWNALSPMDTDIKLSKEVLTLKLKAQALQADVDYSLKQGKIKGKIDVAGLVANISGNMQRILKVKTSISSMKKLGKKLSILYKVGDLPPLEGKIDANLVIDRLKTAELTVIAPKLIYLADKKTQHTIHDVKLVANMDVSKIVLKSYKGTFKKQKYFSTKTAVITLGDTIDVNNLWVNDELKVTGNYNTKTKKGLFTAEASRFHIKDKQADIETEIHLNTTIDGNDTNIEGKVILLKGNITPATQGKTFASDSDIIILQRQKGKQKSSFMNHLSLSIKVESKAPLKMSQKPINLRLKPDFNINKDKDGELQYFGEVEILKGSSYRFEEKRFVLQKSFIYFTGDVNKPILDIKAQYKSLDHLIKIMVTGTPAAPNVNFSSSPSLSREQILSVILFDSDAGGDTQSGNDMMKMMGGAMAKAALSDVGVKVDHLSFGEGNSIEVGKKLTNKITVIYINDAIPKVKLMYQHNKNTESVIGVSEESQSVDIIYKRDF